MGLPSDRVRRSPLLPLVTTLAVVGGALLAGCTSEGSGSPASPATSPAPATSSPPSAASGVPSSAPPSDPPSPSASGLPAYRSSISRIDAGLRDRMRASHRAGCPVPLDRLRYLSVSHVDLRGKVRRGEMVVHADVAEDVVGVFRELYQRTFPIAKMVLVDEYGGDDDRSMAANNTSAYNCRRVAGTDRWSEHAYGKAIDLNPVQNPYVRDETVAPPAGERFADVDRTPEAQAARGVIVADGPVVSAFRRIGWRWGGTWTRSKDYQHFSASGR